MLFWDNVNISMLLFLTGCIVIVTAIILFIYFRDEIGSAQVMPYCIALILLGVTLLYCSYSLNIGENYMKKIDKLIDYYLDDESDISDKEADE